METNKIDARENNMLNGEQGNFRNLQPATAPALQPSLRIDLLCDYSDDDTEEEALKWSQGITQVASDGSNLAKKKRGFHK